MPTLHYRVKKKEQEEKQPPKARLFTCPSTLADETAIYGCWLTKANTAVCVTFDQTEVGRLQAGTVNPYKPLVIMPNFTEPVRIKDLDCYMTLTWDWGFQLRL